MPTPYGSRGGMAFGADELSVLRRALACALRPTPLPDEDVEACLRLAESVDEAVREAGRLRAFLLDDLARYRAALPGSLTGYLELLREALAAGCEPGPDDLAALRALRGNAAAAALLDHSYAIARGPAAAGAALTGSPVVPFPRARLFALTGGRAADEPKQPREPQEPRKPAPPKKRPAPDRPMPKPSEVFPPRRRPKPPPEQRAAG